MSFLAPLFFLGLAAVAVPIFVHLIQRERKDIIEFPSLMFLQKIPYQSVERRRIHNWFLLMLRIGAMALIIAAFSRPFFTSTAATTAAEATGAREVVILLDRSASMGYGNHWSRAQAEAQSIVSGMSGDDRATLVLFDRGVEEAVRATSNRGELEVGIRAATVTSDGTRYAPALREAQSLLSRSDRGRKEAYLISDFQKTGWERQEDIHLPEGATIKPVSVAEPETINVTVSSLAVARASFAGQERATLTAGLTNRGPNTITKQAVRLEIDGKVVDTRDITLGPNASGTVTFDALTVAESNIRGVIRSGSDSLPKDNDFYFVLSPSRTVSVLILQPDGASADTSGYLTIVLGLSKAPPFKADVVPLSRFVPGQLDGRAVVVLNNATSLATPTAEALKRFVEQGGGLFIALGANTPVSGEWPLMPGSLGAQLDRTGMRGGTLGTPDSSHQIFQQFKDPRTGSLANMRFFRYRRLASAPTDQVLVRFDDGATAFVERRVGSGRVIAFTSSLDGEWNDFPKHSMFLPIIHETVRYLGQYSDAEAWYTVGRMLDISVPVAALVREGQATRVASGASGVVVSPSGSQVTLGGASGVPSIELAEQGMYSVRLPGMGDRRPFAVAVNMDPAESDLTPLPPAEFLAGATGRAAVTPAGQSLERPEVTPADIEKKQSLWWFLLVAGLVALLVEAALSNRLSKKFGARFLQTGTAGVRS